VINASLAKYNNAVLRAALALGTHYLDMASHLTKSPFMSSYGSAARRSSMPASHQA
jgi:hypothetical protein